MKKTKFIFSFSILPPCLPIPLSFASTNLSALQDENRGGLRHTEDIINLFCVI